MASGMVEKVARAIWSDRFPDDPWDETNVYDLNDFMGHARAAIEAMREPTEAMIAGAAGNGVAWPRVADAVYRAMIDAALKD